jgi:hypothetical protein
MILAGLATGNILLLSPTLSILPEVSKLIYLYLHSIIVAQIRMYARSALHMLMA